MTALLPTRVSIYDFLYEDTLPIDAMVADLGNISLPQSRIIIENGIQAITFQLLAFNNAQGTTALQKKLFSRNQVKELRKHNAFNLKTMQTSVQHGQNAFEALFHTKKVQIAVTNQLTQLAKSTVSQVQPIIAALTLICLRELVILIDFAHLNAQEIDEWFKLQPQFLMLNRQHSPCNRHLKNSQNDPLIAPPIDPKWFEITGYNLPSISHTVETEEMPHYAKVIGRTKLKSDNELFDLPNGKPLIVDKDNKSDILTFNKMPNISLPYQRWLLQLAKISDIYISRNRLKISPEPIQPPARPMVSFAFMDKDAHEVISGTNPSNNNTIAFWKNPVLIVLVLVIGILGLMALGKFQYKKNHQSDLPEKVTQSQLLNQEALEDTAEYSSH